MSRDLGVPYTDKKPYYFISYNSEDEAIVSQYAAALTKFNFHIWYDNGILIGKPWELEIVEKMENSEAVIMFFSKSIFSKEKSYVYREFELATKHFDKDVYVIMLDEVKETEVPNRFKMWWISITSLQCINSFEYNSPEDCIRVLYENIKASSKNGNADENSEQEENLSIGENDNSIQSQDTYEEAKAAMHRARFKRLANRMSFFAVFLTVILAMCVNYIDITGFSMIECYACIFFIGFAGAYLLFWSTGEYRGTSGLCRLFILSFIGSAILTFGGYVVYVVLEVMMGVSKNMFSALF